ncbi:HEPN domain-containing protein [Synechococcus sp. H60.2]|uniref:HEPN domain-containing protein n=1 Tax=Synechococcus sp. H60.2 TaxID=2964518 RepID=UPI0039C3A9B2
MKPHLEEAWRSLRLADRDLKAFEVLKKDPEVHPSILYFHAQQAVLFAQQIEFTRTHDLVKLARLLGDRGILLPVEEDQLRQLNPFAVAFRYDDTEFAPVPQQEVASLLTAIRRWAAEEVSAATEREKSNGSDYH